MPPVKVEIAIVVSVTPVGPRKANLKDQPFAMHVSAAYKTAPATPMENLEKILRPWLSGWVFKRALVKVEDATLAVSEVDGKEIASPRRKPEAIDRNLTTLQAQITRGKEQIWNPEVITQAKNGNQTAKPLLIEAVHALSLYPGEIPQKSRLINYFIADGWPASPKRFIAAPEFSFVLNINDADMKVNCKLKALANLDDWHTGWEYELLKDDGTPVNLGDLDLKILAYSKPLNVAQTTGLFLFDGEALAGDANLGPNFRDYWLRTQIGGPWINRIRDLEQFVTDLNERMMQARGTLGDTDPVLLEGWDDLRLMALALYGQWDRPAVINDCTIEPNDDKQLIALLTAQLGLMATEAAGLADRLTKFHNELKEQGDPAERAKRRALWLSVFKKAFNDPTFKDPNKNPTVTVQTLLQRAVEAPVDFDLVLFYQWDFAVEHYAPNPDNDTLLERWKEKFTPLVEKWLSRTPEDKINKSVEAPLSLFLEAQTAADPAKMNYGVRTLKKKYWLCVSQDLLKEPSSEKVAQRLGVEFKNLRTRLDIKSSSNFFPQLASENVLGAEVWKKLWANWAGDKGYVARYVKQIVPPPDTEEKPGGLTIVFDKPSPKGQQPPKEEQSVWRKLAGVGVLVREKKANPKEGWHLATAATLNLRGIRIIRVAKVIKDGQEDKRSIELTVDVYPNAREEKYHLSVGDETFLDVFAVASGNVTTQTDPVKITPNHLEKGARFQTLVVTRTDKDWTDAAQRQVRFDKLLVDTALVPMRVPFRNGVRNPSATYNQRSLIAPSNLSDAVSTEFGASDERDDKRSVILDEALYEYGPAQNGKPIYNLVPLKFGKTYEMAAFMIDTAGGLPAELSKGAPWVFKETDFDMPSGSPVIQAFPYLRKVPVGQVRVSHLKEINNVGDVEAISWPEWPENISPLAGETISNNKKKDDEPTDPPEKRKRQTQLALLYGDEKQPTSKFLFGIKPPAFDLDVLERWENTDDDDTNKRLHETVKQYFARLIKRKGDISVNVQNKEEDATFDDLAVTHFLFILESYNFEEPNEKKKWKVESFCVPEIQRAGVMNISYYQQDWKKVFCQKGAAFEVKESGANIQVTVRETEASVARLKTFALVSTDFIKAGSKQKFREDFFEAPSTDPFEEFKQDPFEEFKFKEDVLNDPRYQIPAGMKVELEKKIGGFVCLKPFSFLLETPNANMPDATDLWLNLTLRTSGVGRDSLQVFLQQPQSQRALFRNIIRCDLLRQKWRWQGRPLDQQSVIHLKTDWTDNNGLVRDEKLNDVVSWELSAFAEMHDIFDTLTIPLPFKFQSIDPLYTDDYQKDLLAHYLRYALRAYSRYEGLFPDKALPVISKQPYTKSLDNADLSDTGNNVLSGFGWRRVLLRYRGPKPSKPHIKAIVPLTKTYRFEDSHDRVSLNMVVLEETMFGQCGITEAIECRVEKATLYEGANELVCSASDKRKTFHQAGHDPILSAENAACELPDASKVTLRLTPEGPFGHTFDTGARVSLFGASSFLFRPFEYESTNEKGELVKRGPADWDFAKVSFRRLSGNESPEDVGEDKDWTIPVWLYFLPPSHFNIPDWDHHVSLAWDKAAKRLTLAPHDTELFKQLEKRKMFKYCLILTRSVHDFRGEGDQEIYASYVRLEFAAGASILKKDFGEDLPAGTEYKARLVEVQVTRKTPDGQFEELPDSDKEFWDKLLKANLEDDDKDSDNAMFRITRVSPPKLFNTGK